MTTIDPRLKAACEAMWPTLMAFSPQQLAKMSAALKAADTVGALTGNEKTFSHCPNEMADPEGCSGCEANGGDDCGAQFSIIGDPREHVTISTYAGGTITLPPIELPRCPHSDGNSCEQYRLQGQRCQDCPGLQETTFVTMPPDESAAAALKCYECGGTDIQCPICLTCNPEARAEAGAAAIAALEKCKAFIARVDELTPAIDAVVHFGHIHGWKWPKGANWVEERIAAQSAISAALASLKREGGGMTACRWRSQRGSAPISSG